MNVSSVMGAGLQGIQRGMEGLQKNAKEIATLSSDEDINIGDLAQSAVDMKLNELQVKASVAVIKTSSDTIGSLLDMRA